MSAVVLHFHTHVGDVGDGNRVKPPEETRQLPRHCVELHARGIHQNGRNTRKPWVANEMMWERGARPAMETELRDRKKDDEPIRLRKRGPPELLDLAEYAL